MFPELSEPASVPRRSLLPALGASLALHGFLLLWLIDSVIITPAEPDSPPSRLSLTLVQRSRPLAPAEETPPAAATDAADATTTVDATTTADATTADAAGRPGGLSPRPATAEPAEGGAGSAVTLDGAAVQGSIRTYVQGLRSQQTAVWTATCVRHEAESGRGDCPGQQGLQSDLRDEQRALASRVFAPVTRPDQHARLRRELLAREGRMQQLQEQGGPTAQLAVERAALTREYLAYLNGNLNSPALAFVQATQRDNPNLPFMLGNMLQFICNPAPCIYEYTDFTTGRREPAVVEQATALDALPLQPWVPRVRLQQTAGQ